jgi:His-Xaa-Ser system radical SAM maturase HxsC
MLLLSGRPSRHQFLDSVQSRMIVRLSEQPNEKDRTSTAQLFTGETAPEKDVAAYVLVGDETRMLEELPRGVPTVVLPESFRYLKTGDVIRIAPEDGAVRVLYRRESLHNSFLVTERCDNYCLMCSQPPKDVDDVFIVHELLEAVALIDPETKEIGFTGGEPTLLGELFLDVVRACRRTLPATAVHVLSNGRRFADWPFSKAWAEVDHPDLIIGIPLYSDLSTVHDYVVQADGAYDEAVRGILNLKRLNQRVELRVVLHNQTYGRLDKLAEFITRNLLFVDHVALMGLEIMGFTKANLPALWIDPIEYQSQLRQAVRILSSAGINVSIYNLPLCLLEREVWEYSRQSISDWKNEFLPQCDDCDVRSRCAGFFSSARYKSSSHISPIRLS